MVVKGVQAAWRWDGTTSTNLQVIWGKWVEMTKRPNRRTFLKISAAALASLPQLVRLGKPAKAQTVRTRRAMHKPEAAGMVELYRQGVEILRGRPEYDSTSWLFQARIHWIPAEDNSPVEWDRIFDPNQSQDPAEQERILAARKIALDEDNNFQNRLWVTCPHTSQNSFASHFLTWHRLYLYWFERIIEDAVGEPFAMPYWDYTNPAQNALPVQLREEINGSQQANPLFFSERRADVNSLTAPKLLEPGDVDWEIAVGQMGTLPEPGADGFSFNFEQTPHGDIHMFVGTTQGMASVAYAARDPVFWLHHANIDRLWESWRAGANNTDPSSTTWLENKHAFAHPDGSRVEMSAGDALEPATNLGYEYDALEPIPPVLVAGGGTAFTTGGPVVVAASDPQEMAVVIDKDAKQFTLKAVPGSAEMFASFGDARQLILVLKGISATVNPGTRLNVYINLSDNPDENEYRRQQVGAFNLFGQVPHLFGDERRGVASQIGSQRQFNVKPEQIGPVGLDLRITIIPTEADVTVPVNIESVSLEFR